MTQPYDVAVLGATPAGYVAARRLAEQGGRVVVIDAPRRPAYCPLCDWVGRGFFSSDDLPPSLVDDCEAEGFRDVCYHSADLAREARHVSRTAAGYFLDPKKLTKALRESASAGGADCHKARKLPEIRLEETAVRVLTSRPVHAQLLLIAQDRPADVLGELALPIRSVPRGSLALAGLDVPLDAGAGPDAREATLHVVSSQGRRKMGMFFHLGETLHLRTISQASAADSGADELSSMVADLQRAKLLPPDLPLDRAVGAVWRPPAGVALELETHVAKRCLLIGTAGGFAEALTGQTLAASVRSALLASDIVLDALQSEDCQGTLMRFKTSWRRSLANFIRPPSASLQMLLPLVFVNRQMAGRFTAALLEGRSM